MKSVPTAALFSVVVILTLAAPASAGVELPKPILFVSQVPIPADFATVGSVFANHRADLMAVGRGGDLFMRYGDGTLRNLTAEAGYGVELDGIFADGFESGDTSAWSQTVP